MSLRRVVLDIAGFEPFIGRRNLLRLRKARTQRAEQPGSRHRPDREPADPLEKRAAVDVAVHVLVEHQHHLGIKVTRTLHRLTVGHDHLP